MDIKVVVDESNGWDMGRVMKKASVVIGFLNIALSYLYFGFDLVVFSATMSILALVMVWFNKFAAKYSDVPTTKEEVRFYGFVILIALFSLINFIFIKEMMTGVLK